MTTDHHPGYLQHLHEAVPEAYADRDELTEAEAAALAVRGADLGPGEEGPSPFHVFSEDGWALPAERELKHLDEMKNAGKDSVKDAKKRLANQREQLKEWEESQHGAD